jgi:hypothetical protein
MATKDNISFQLRIPPGLRRQLQRAAKKSGRSTNTEAVERLLASFSDEGVGEGALPDQALSLDKVIEKTAEKAAEMAARQMTKGIVEDAVQGLATRIEQLWHQQMDALWKGLLAAQESPSQVRPETKVYPLHSRQAPQGSLGDLAMDFSDAEPEENERRHEEKK